MPDRSSRRDRRSRIISSISYVVFVGAGLFYIFQPPNSTTDYFDSPLPAILWGIVFAVGGLLAIRGTLTKFPHIERLGLMLIIIAGAVLSLTQLSVMLAVPITWTRGGGTAAYAAFTLIALALWTRLGDKVEAINLSAENRGGDGS